MKQRMTSVPNRFLLSTLALCAAAVHANPPPIDTIDPSQLAARLAEAGSGLSDKSIADEKALVQRISGNGRLSPALARLAYAHRNKGMGDLQQKAFSLGIPLAGDSVAVALVAEPGADSQALERRVSAAGGQITSRFGETVYAELPVASIEGFREDEGLYLMREQAIPQPAGSYEELMDQLHSLQNGTSGDSATPTNDMDAPVDDVVASPVSESAPATAARAPKPAEGVRLMHVDRLHAAGITGKSVKVGVLDMGFLHHEALVRQGVIPKPVAVQTFGPEPLDASAHGTACAEIIHAVAPDAQLYLASISNEGSFIEATDWLVKQGVDVISVSLGFLGNRTDGRSIFDNKVDEVYKQSGIVWAISAGNEGNEHWMGLSVDKNRDGFIDTGAWPAILFQSLPGQPFMVMAHWDDWGPNPERPAATEDIDLKLLTSVDGEKWENIAVAPNPQNGHQAPTERVIHKPNITALYAVKLKATRVSKPVKVHVLVAGGIGLMPALAKGSLRTPGTARGAVTIGAISAAEDTLEAYSSQGPTDDGRTKPDVVAPAGVRSSAMKLERRSSDIFAGTSAAAPHAAGFAALLKQKYPALDAAGLRKMLVASVVERGARTPNNTFGFGRLDATRIPEAAPPAEAPAAGSGAAPSGGNALERLRRLLQE